MSFIIRFSSRSISGNKWSEGKPMEWQQNYTKKSDRCSKTWRQRNLELALSTPVKFENPEVSKETRAREWLPKKWKTSHDFRIIDCPQEKKGRDLFSPFEDGRWWGKSSDERILFETSSEESIRRPQLLLSDESRSCWRHRLTTKTSKNGKSMWKVF